MRKIIIVLIILASMTIIPETQGMSINEVKLALISKIAHALVKEKVVKVYVSDKHFIKQPKNSFGIKYVNDCKKAQLVIAREIKKIKKTVCKNKLIFFTNYSNYQKYKPAIGALFWQKGRPMLLFKESVLKKRHIVLPDSFKKYIDYGE